MYSSFPPFVIFGRTITINTYGICLVTGAIAAILLAVFTARRYKVQRDDMLYIGLLAAVGGLLGAKLLYLIVSIPSFIEDPRNLLNAIAGGFVFYGGLIGGFLVAVIYTRHYKLPFWRIADVAAPCLPLAHAFGRVGCFLAGCCYGRVSEKYGLRFHTSLAGPRDVPFLPTQLYECGALLLICATVLIAHPRLKRDGQAFGLYVVMYAIARFIIEFFRGDIRGGFLFFSTSQWISLLILPIGILLLFFPDKMRLLRKYEAEALQ